MRPLRALIIYITVVFLGGALLAPWLYWLAQAGAASFPKLADAPFHRFVNRSVILFALAGLWPLFRELGARSAGDLGLVKPAGQWRKLFAGLLVGFISLAVVAALALAGGGRVLQENLALSKIVEKLLVAALTAVTVAALEEILFRGGIFGGLRRVFDWPRRTDLPGWHPGNLLRGWRFALGLSSAVYAITHFFAAARPAGDVTGASGLMLLPPMLLGFADWQALIPGFFNLTLAGGLLALAYQRTGNLYFSIGLHAGWIFWPRSYGVLTTGTSHTNLWLWGSSRMIDGWLAFIVLSITLAVFLRLRPVEKTIPTA
jgi:hypothetical protein